MRLVEMQQRLRDAVVTGNAWPVALELSGGARALGRVRIHQRHYEASLVAALMGRFPATGWLTGTSWLEQAARDFVHEQPPATPCIAEYGAGLPAFMMTRENASRMPYLQDFADLDWHLGSVALAVEEPALAPASVAAFDARALNDALVHLQPGLYYAVSDWPVDQLIRLYLQGSAPANFEMLETTVWIELRGARGELRISRLSAGDFAFRDALQGRVALGAAAAHALTVDPTFDPGRALVALVEQRLICGLHTADEGFQ